MQQLAVRRLVSRLLLLASVFMLGSGCSDSRGPLRRFLLDPGHRHEILKESLLSRENDYATLRLARYGSMDSQDWLRLPEFLPATIEVSAADQSHGMTQAAWSVIDVSLPAADEDEPSEQALREALRQIGKTAFFRYPAQLVSGFEAIRRDPLRAAEYGLWQGRTPTHQQQLGGLLDVKLPDGSVGIATSCSTCHAAAVSGEVIPGATNSALDMGKLAIDSGQQAEGPPLAWGRGRLDTSDDGVDNPAAIPDLRVVAMQRALHHSATLHSNLLALAVRIETLLITTYRQGVRPPPSLALGLAVYLWSLSGELPPEQSSENQSVGASLFAQHCAHCHLPPHYSGDPVPLAVIGTDPALGISRERGTGWYRTPSLRSAKLRQQFLHHGVLPSVAAVLDPQRLLHSYRDGNHGPGPIRGHLYGLTISASERAALTAFVETL